MLEGSWPLDQSAAVPVLKIIFLVTMLGCQWRLSYVSPPGDGKNLIMYAKQACDYCEHVFDVSMSVSKRAKFARSVDRLCRGVGLRSNGASLSSILAPVAAIKVLAQPSFV